MENSAYLQKFITDETFSSQEWVLTVCYEYLTLLPNLHLCYTVVWGLGQIIWVSLWGWQGGWCWWVNWYLYRYVHLVYVVGQFCPWFKFYFPLFLGMVIYDNEFEIKKNKIWTKENRIKLNNNITIWFIAKIFSNVMTGFSHFN